MATDADLQAAYERVHAANRRLEEIWSDRVSKPDETRSAIDEMNKAGTELNRIREELEGQLGTDQL